MEQLELPFVLSVEQECDRLLRRQVEIKKRELLRRETIIKNLKKGYVGYVDENEGSPFYGFILFKSGIPRSRKGGEII